ncbi:MAG TPA: TatD family hydrolase [Candidatus Paceibacterota bacterium]|nr:TatD family hydrolase [Candidatus Paceibacterota bacterium]
MTYIDVHCHIDRYNDEQVEAIMERAREKGVGIIINNGNNFENNERTLEFCEKYPEVRAAMGIFPIECLQYTDKQLSDFREKIRKLHKNKKVIAIGEVGLDFKEDLDNWEKQKEIFEEWIKLSIELNIPIIVHSRKAELEAIEILEKFNKSDKKPKVIMHCFSGSMKLVQRIFDNGWYFSIPTSIKNSQHFQLVVEKIPIEKLFCETDSPFLHPDKLRDNEPANVIVSYQKIAEIKKMRLKDIEKQIEKNFKSLFEI